MYKSKYSKETLFSKVLDFQKYRKSDRYQACLCSGLLPYRHSWPDSYDAALPSMFAIKLRTLLHDLNGKSSRAILLVRHSLGDGGRDRPIF